MWATRAALGTPSTGPTTQTSPVPRTLPRSALAPRLGDPQRPGPDPLLGAIAAVSEPGTTLRARHAQKHPRRRTEQLGPGQAPALKAIGVAIEQLTILRPTS